MKKRNTTKGTAWRPHDADKFGAEFDRIFRKRRPDPRKPVKVVRKTIKLEVAP